MTTAPSWRTGHRGGACVTCETPFEPPVEVGSALLLAPVGESGAEETFLRRDFCVE